MCNLQQISWIRNTGYLELLKFRRLQIWSFLDTNRIVLVYFNLIQSYFSKGKQLKLLNAKRRGSLQASRMAT